MSRVTPKILKEEGGAHEEKGEHARLQAFVGAIAVADLVKSTLGPKGMDKILQSTSSPHGKITITNDGATILNAVPVDNPAAKVLIDISKTQDNEVGDGTTSVVLFAGELLREAEKLVNAKIHPQTIISGYRKALAVAQKTLESISVRNPSTNTTAFRENLVQIAQTTLSSKIVSVNRNYFANLAVDAILRLKGGRNLEMIQIVKKHGATLRDSYLEEGFILNKKFGVGQSKRIEKAKIMVANTPMDTDKIKIFGAKVKVDDMSKVAEIEKAEKEKMRHKVEKILQHNIDIFINRQLIYNYPEQIFTQNKVTSIEHADFEGIERLAFVLGAEILSTFDEKPTLGYADLVEEIIIGEDQVIRFSGCKKGEACSIVLRGSTPQILDEAERSLHDALCVIAAAVHDQKIVVGGGAAEMAMAKVVDDLAKDTSGKQSLAIEAFSRALRIIPTTLADNAGFDSSELISQLRAVHNRGENQMGLDMENGVIADMKKLKVTEAFKVKSTSLLSAHEAAEMILRVDDIIKCAPRPRKDPRDPRTRQ